MKNYFIALFALSTLINCTKTEIKTAENTEDNTEIVEQKFVVDSLSVADSMSLSKNLTADFQKTILVFPGITDKTLLDSIYAKENINLKSYSRSDLKAALDAKMQEYFAENKKVLEDYSPDFEQTWNETSSMKVHSKIDQFLTIKYSGDGYTGGAHGYYYEFYKNFNLEKNSVVQLKDVFSNQNPKMWNDLLVKNFLRENEEEMLFEKKIPLTDNFYFNEKNITFIYNQYEVAPYSSGVIIVNVPFSELSSYLNPQFKKDFNLK